MSALDVSKDSTEEIQSARKSPGEGNAEKRIEKSQRSRKKKSNRQRVMQSKNSFVSK